MKNESLAIRKMMRTFGCPEGNADAIVGQVKIVLDSVRNMYWRTKTKAEIIQSEATGVLSANLGAALLYLSDLAPIEEQREFEQRIARLFEDQSIIRVLEQTHQAIKDYPVKGEQYHAILKEYYFDEQDCTDAVIYHKLNLERTLYYQRKREAVLLFGLQLSAYSFALHKHST